MSISSSIQNFTLSYLLIQIGGGILFNITEIVSIIIAVIITLLFHYFKNTRDVGEKPEKIKKEKNNGKSVKSNLHVMTSSDDDCTEFVFTNTGVISK